MIERSAGIAVRIKVVRTKLTEIQALHIELSKVDKKIKKESQKHNRQEKTFKRVSLEQNVNRVHLFFRSSIAYGQSICAHSKLPYANRTAEFSWFNVCAFKALFLTAAGVKWRQLLLKKATVRKPCFAIIIIVVAAMIVILLLLVERGTRPVGILIQHRTCQYILDDQRVHEHVMKTYFSRIALNTILGHLLDVALKA